MRAPDMSGTGLEALGRGMQSLAQGADQYANAQQEVRLRFASATAKDADNQVRQFYADTGFNGSSGFYNLNGKDALTAQPEFQGALEAKVKEVRSQLKDPISQRYFDRAMGEQHAEWTRQIGAHVDQQTTKYAIDQSASRVGLALNAATTAIAMPPSSDPSAPTPLDESDKQLATARNEIEHLGQAQGWTPEHIAFEQTMRVSGARHDIGIALNQSGAQGPQMAQAYLDKYRSDFTGDHAASLQTNIRTLTNAQLAEQRRAEAEQRRIQSEAKHDAGVRAEDVHRTIAEGGIVAPDVLANAMRDAQTAERPALVDGLKLGSLKNNLSLQYRDTPPAQLRNDLNTLGAKISKAGANATVEGRTAFEHLSTLLGKTTSELNADPISWGATHSGIDPGPLNLNDPRSVQAHIDAGRRVSQHTGAPLRLMTNADAAILQGQLTTGSAAQRKDVIGKLAQFGAVSQIAASQIAPGNDALANAVGLAGGSNRAAAQQHLDLLTAGQDILKTNPKLIKQAEAETAFAAHVGNALELLPTVGRGARINATNMAAAVAQHNGAGDWASGGRDAFSTTISDAFGAYRDAQGVVRGGIGTINNRKTLLPDGWSGTEVENVLAKAPAAKWQRSWNGAPIAANGQPFTYDQLRKMQIVAAPSGAYRLSDGSRYVTKKGGGFFELDIRKMR